MQRGAPLKASVRQLSQIGATTVAIAIQSTSHSNKVNKMATKVACYDIITDGDTTLKIGGDIDVDLPIGVGSGINVGVRSVLSFMLKAENPNNLQFELSIKNGSNVTTSILKVTIGSNIWRVFQEVVSANVLTATGNILKVKVLSGAGTLVVSDIVLLYMKDV